MESRREPPPALRLKGVTVRYGDRLVLDVPDLTVAAGEVLAVMGRNGAGKSTLLHVAAGLRRPEGGDVWITGEQTSRRSARRLRRRTVMVLQAPLLFDVSVLANAASGLRFRGVSRREAERGALAWLGRFGVAHLARQNALTLSGGEAQRVSLARAFAVGPELLLLDEPFASLDAPTREALVPELAAWLREQNTAAVLATHDATDAHALADRLLVLDDGQIRHLGPARDALNRSPSGDGEQGHGTGDGQVHANRNVGR